MPGNICSFEFLFQQMKVRLVQNLLHFSIEDEKLRFNVNKNFSCKTNCLSKNKERDRKTCTHL